MSRGISLVKDCQVETREQSMEKAAAPRCLFPGFFWVERPTGGNRDEIPDGNHACGHMSRGRTCRSAGARCAVQPSQALSRSPASRRHSVRNIHSPKDNRAPGMPVAPPRPARARRIRFRLKCAGPPEPNPPPAPLPGLLFSLPAPFFLRRTKGHAPCHTVCV
jgi:hypothetical protein